MSADTIILRPADTAILFDSEELPPARALIPT
jgi:hypothetical protein